MASSTKNSIHWFRKGLRLKDNPAFVQSIATATKEKSHHYSVYVVDGDCYQIKHCSALRANFLVECLQDLNNRLESKGSRLFCPKGDPIVVLPKLWTEFSITHMTFEQDETGEPYAKARDEAILTLAKEHGIQVETFASETLHPLASYVTKAPKDKVPNTMGSFQKLFHKMGTIAQPLTEPETIPSFNDKFRKSYLPPTKPTSIPWPRTVPRENVTPIWDSSDCENLTPIVRGGETNARNQLAASITAKPTYVATFEKPQTSCTSLQPSTTVLSPYMSLGCLSPRTVWHAISESSARSSSKTRSKPPVSLHGQLLWRDFNNLMAHTANLNVPGSWGQMEGNMHCRAVPWNAPDEDVLEKWQNGQTGYPWIDAAMRQLQQEGWIHHLGRHAVACFLTRGDLWQSWELGAEWFESQLLDADYALNGFNWLWLSCSGFFYQYFRCYSPVAFQKKKDPNGTYIRHYCPELKKLPNKYIYEPHTAPKAVLESAGIVLGETYPRPMVDHAVVSKENMSKMAAAYQTHKNQQGSGKGSKSSTSTTATKKRAATPAQTGKKSKQTKLNF